jgi:hypothetical protein
MKWLCFAFFAGTALAQDITFPNRTATFTNLQGRVFKDVTLIKADLDGVVWREGAGGGRICYTNLSPALLEAWGIPTNRIGVARARAQRKAATDAQYRAAQAQAAVTDKASRENQQIARREQEKQKDLQDIKDTREIVKELIKTDVELGTQYKNAEANEQLLQKIKDLEEQYRAKWHEEPK